MEEDGLHLVSLSAESSECLVLLMWRVEGSLCGERAPGCGALQRNVHVSDVLSIRPPFITLNSKFSLISWLLASFPLIGCSPPAPRPLNLWEPCDQGQRRGPGL